MKLLGEYNNGNYHVQIFDDGTKIRESEDDEFHAVFPENMDVKISNYCDIGCEMCHEASGLNGEHGDIMNPKFINSLQPYTEMAIGGGDATSHPDLIPFLKKLKEKHILANMTIHQTHFEEKQELIRKLVDKKLIYGLGVSFSYQSKDFIPLIKQYDNAVIHVINGLLTSDNAKYLSDNGLKMLILGYKQFRKGTVFFEKEQEFIEENQVFLYKNLPQLLSRFKVVSFDNLAIEQLRVERMLSKEKWEEFYMGDDGKHTMYVDLVEQKFARCSIAKDRYDLLSDVKDMFEIVLKEADLAVSTSKTNG